MWSGSNSEKWRMNPSVPFMTVPHEQVDWASLAQQWIKMKESAPQVEKEGGEAPMEIAKDDAPVYRDQEWMASHPADATSTTWSEGNWAWDQAGAWMQWAGAPGAPATSDLAASGYATAPGYTTVPEPPVVPPPPVYSFNPSVQPPPAPPDQYNRGFWTDTPPIENSKHSHWNLVGSSKKKHLHSPPSETVPELDAAKRRALPAWIRDGLEKMEREKQKKAELERLQKLEKDLSPDANDLNNVEVVPTNGDLVELPRKSRFDSESEEEKEPNAKLTEPAVTPRRSRFDQSEPPAVASQLPLKPMFRSKEQILHSVMADVRRILTQILMEVTTEEIEKAVEETHKQFKKKAPAATLRKTPAFGSLTGKLGLGIYESDSDSDSEPEKVTNEPDSDQELRDRIERLKNDFTHVEEEMERHAAELEEKERKALVKHAERIEKSPKAEDQVHLSGIGSSASRNEKVSSNKNVREDVRSNIAREGETVKEVDRRDRHWSDHGERRTFVRKSPDVRNSERKDGRSSERKDYRNSERKDRRSSEGKDRRSSERKDLKTSERSRSARKSDSSRSSWSSSSRSSSEEASSSPRPRRDKKKRKHPHHHRHHHRHRREKKSHSESSSRSRSRSRSWGSRRHKNAKRPSNSRRKSSTEGRKRQRSSSSSSSSGHKYGKRRR